MGFFSDSLLKFVEDIAFSVQLIFFLINDDILWLI